MTEFQNDWDPGTYNRFRDLRLRPALDLLSAIGPLPSGDIVDLGCGSGAAGAALRSAAAQERQLIGVDQSRAMLEDAQRTGAYDALICADIAEWRADRRWALLFCNAALHWLPDHAELLPSLVEMLPSRGWFAAQMPGQNMAPSHAAWRDLSGSDGASDIETPLRYAEILAPLGSVRVWETVYYQQLVSSEDGHPVRNFTEATYGKPFLERSSDPMSLRREYDALMDKFYPPRADGSVMFPFRRVFFVLQKV